MPRNKAIKADDIGIENSKPEDIIEALRNARATADNTSSEITKELLVELGLTGLDNSKELRFKVMDILGIGYGNAKNMLKKLNGFNISKELLIDAVEKAING